jgi:putative sigma-54 modulation protein
MKLLIHGRNLDVTPAIREYTETKLNRAISHFDGIVKEADVHLSVARNPRVPQQTAEVTVFANGVVIRAQERSENLYASIDLVATKLSRQLAVPPRGVRRKYFAMPAMDLEEALHQLDLIDHDFYMFRDAATGQIQVVYRRNHGGFGVIQARDT